MSPLLGSLRPPFLDSLMQKTLQLNNCGCSGLSYYFLEIIKNWPAPISSPCLQNAEMSRIRKESLAGGCRLLNYRLEILIINLICQLRFRAGRLPEFDNPRCSSTSLSRDTLALTWCKIVYSGLVTFQSFPQIPERSHVDLL